MIYIPLDESKIVNFCSIKKTKSTMSFVLLKTYIRYFWKKINKILFENFVSINKIGDFKILRMTHIKFLVKFWFSIKL